MNKDLKVSHLMTQGVIFSNVNTEFSKVLKFFLQYKVNHLPVVDDAEKVVGIISTYDALNAFKEMTQNNETLSEENINDKIKVESIMTKNPATINPDETVGHVAQIFHVNKFQALPVVKNDKLVGIITTRDLVGWIARSGADTFLGLS